MGAKQMSDSQVQRFVTSMEEQGVGVTRIKKGLFLRLPDKTTVTVHFTNSDVRAFDNLLARLRRAGVRHPEDPKNVAQLPSQITSGTVMARTKKKVMEGMAELGYPDIVHVMQVVGVTGMEHVTTARALYHMGFKPIAGKRNSRDWMTPDNILSLKPKQKPSRVPAEFEAEQESSTLPPDDVDRFGKTVAEQEAERQTPHTDAALTKFVEGARAAQATVDAMGMGVPRETTELSTETVRNGNGREFIDTHDSWIVELTRLPMSMTIGDYLQSLDATGLAFEVRVWRNA